MKTPSKFIFSTLAGIALGIVSTQAQWTYLDATDFLHSGDGDGTTGAGPLANTWLDAEGTTPWQTDLGDGTDLWRYRYSGPGAPAAGGTAYQGRSQEGDPDLYTIISGLEFETEYTVKLYGVWGGGKPSWAMSYSLAGGSWSAGIDYDVVDAAKALGYGQGWVDADDNPLPEKDGDTRGNVIMGSAMSDAEGKLVVGIRHVAGSAGLDRAAYDGVAYAIGVVPEPSSFALVGLGTAALMIFRRRR